MVHFSWTRRGPYKRAPVYVYFCSFSHSLTGYVNVYSNIFHSDGAPKLRGLRGLIFFFPPDSYPNNQTAHRADIRRSRHRRRQRRRRRQGGDATDADGGDRVFRRNLRSPPDAQETVDEAEKRKGEERRGFLGA